jgi:hypothetical protein
MKKGKAESIHVPLLQAVARRQEMNHARKASTLEQLKRHNIMSFATIGAASSRRRPRSPMPIDFGDVIYPAQQGAVT